MKKLCRNAEVANFVKQNLYHCQYTFGHGCYICTVVADWHTTKHVNISAIWNQIPNTTQQKPYLTCTKHHIIRAANLLIPWRDLFSFSTPGRLPSQTYLAEHSMSFSSPLYVYVPVFFSFQIKMPLWRWSIAFCHLYLTQYDRGRTRKRNRKHNIKWEEKNKTTHVHWMTSKKKKTL